MNKSVQVFLLVLFIYFSFSANLAYGGLLDDLKNNFQNQTINFINQGKQKIQESVDSTKKKFQNTIEQGKEKIQESVVGTKTNIQNKIEEGKQQFQEGFDDFNSTIQDVTNKGKQYGSEMIEEGKKKYGDDIQQYTNKTQEFIKKIPQDPETLRKFASDQWEKRSDNIWDFTTANIAKEMGMDENDPMVEPTSQLVNSLSNPFKSDEELSADLNTFFTEYLHIIAQEDFDYSDSSSSSSSQGNTRNNSFNRTNHHNSSYANYLNRNQNQIQLVPQTRDIKVVSVDIPLFIPTNQSQQGRMFVWNGSIPLFFPGTQLGFVLRINVYSNIEWNGMKEIAL